MTSAGGPFLPPICVSTILAPEKTTPLALAWERQMFQSYLHKAKVYVYLTQEWLMLLSSSDAVWIRYLLSRALYRMKRPELSDLLPHACFQAHGRELFIAIPEAHDAQLTSVFSTAVLNSGLPFDSAVVLAE